MCFFLHTTQKSYSSKKKRKMKKNTKQNIEKQRQRLRCAEQSRVRWRWRFGNRHWKGSSQKQKHFLHFLWWIHKIHTQRKVDKIYRMSPVGSRRALRCWNRHVRLWILQINISFEHFVRFFSRCPCLYPSPFLYHFWKIEKKNRNSKWKKDVHNIRRIQKNMF